MIEDAGMVALEAANADEAIEILEARNDISVMFTDIEMPGSIDGVRLAAAVRDRWPPIRIIVTSGHVKNDQIALPADVLFFGKPYDTARVTQEVRRLIGEG